jgi:hypothetical protein
MKLATFKHVLKPRNVKAGVSFKFPSFQAPPPKIKSYHEFSEAVKHDEVQSVTVKEKVIDVHNKNGEEYTVKATNITQNTYEQLIEHDVSINKDIFSLTDALNIGMYVLLFANSIVFLLILVGRSNVVY